MEDELHRYEELSRETQTGWWVANLNTKEFKCSKFISELLGIESDTFSFDYFISKISDEYREVILKDVTEYDSPQSEYCRTMYAANTPRGKVWVSAHTSPKIALDNGDVIRKGFIHLIDPPQEDKEPIILTKVRDLTLGLSTISNMLKDFFTNEDEEGTINKILQEILRMFHGDRSYVLIYEDNCKYQSCKYEVVEPGIEAEIDNLKHIPINETPWWTQKLLKKESIILDDILKLPEEAQAEFNILRSQDIKSLMVVPLISKDMVLGYLGIDLVKRHYNWTKEDYQWLLSMANIISIFMTFRENQQELNKEQEKLSAANHSLKKNEEKIQKIFANIPIGAAYYDLEGHPTQYNNKCMDLFGLSSIKDAQNYTFFKDSNIPTFVFESIKVNDFIEYEVEYNFDLLKDILKTWRTGSTKLYFKTAKLHDNNGECTGYLTAVIDETDKMMVSNRVSDFESFFSIISESAKIGYAKINLLSNKGYAIKQWYANVGEDEKTPLAQIIREYKHLHPDDREDIFNFYEEVKHGTAKHYEKEVRVHLPNNPFNKWNVLYKNLVVTRFAPDEGDIEVIGVSYDITELKDAVEELRKARDKAQEMDRLKMAFLANMSHEIRTPLNSIIGFADLLAYSDKLDDKQAYINILHENSDLLLQLISDILDLSKIESGMIDFSFNVINVNMLCTDLIQVMKSKVKRGVALEFDRTLPNYHIISDWKRVQQVLNNLISNAIKFTTNGYIKLEYSLKNDMIQFDVTDTGIGIKEEMLPKIFGRFVKLNSFVQGTGLGLSICKSIIEGMHGQIGVESTYGKGTHFWFTLPYDNSVEGDKEKLEQIMTTNAPVEDEPTQKDKLILVAEDEESNYELLYAILNEQYNIVWAQNGVKTVELYKELKPDLILMDIKMDEMDGIEATEIIRKTDKKLPIIAITAYAFERDKIDAINAGCDDFMTKPIFPNELRRKIAKYLNK